MDFALNNEEGWYTIKHKNQIKFWLNTQLSNKNLHAYTYYFI